MEFLKQANYIGYVMWLNYQNSQTDKITITNVRFQNLGLMYSIKLTKILSKILIFLPDSSRSQAFFQTICSSENLALTQKIIKKESIFAKDKYE